MSTYEAQRPIFRVRCDGDGCTAEFEPNSDWISRFADNTSRAAGHAGWDVPPLRGKGSRRGTHFCPQCKAAQERLRAALKNITVSDVNGAPN